MRRLGDSAILSPRRAPEDLTPRPPSLAGKGVPSATASASAGSHTLTALVSGRRWDASWHLGRCPKPPAGGHAGDTTSRPLRWSDKGR